MILYDQIVWGHCLSICSIYYCPFAQKYARREIWRHINRSTIAFFSQGSRSIYVPAEMIAPLINFGEKIVHLVDSGNVMKQGWLWEVWIFSSFIFLSFFCLPPSFKIIALDLILLCNASKNIIYSIDSGRLSHGAFFIFTYSIHIFGIWHRTKRHEVRIRN